VRGNIAGIASSVPKGLPFNFPSIKQQDFFEDQGDSFVISGYFKDPDSESQTQAERFFTNGGCFPTMVACIKIINLLKDRGLIIV